ncbi:meprin A subunit beta [Ornithorhynchus anatinus]|uniref:meprin A subunit beta n=1 Tax=Ornithorhynchus anatinus TaxID=9258 RepID=UPI0019D45EB5|nr:meprin A subunit beta [Ornithorhynchus anatinus]
MLYSQGSESNEIGKAYTYMKPTPETYVKDVDGGVDRDIFDINSALGLDLFEGDIVFAKGQDRNSIIGDRYRWPHIIPYVLEDSLEMNAKGVILNAFERYRLKTCIDFKPWEGEANYISVFKGSGCWSSIGNQHKGKQQLSIGENCDRIGTIQHEFLHALGFWHEQSRADRDDYVMIMWNRIQAGKENNFNVYDDTKSNSLNTPYDYTSVMHYSKTAFQNGTLPTIITKIDDFLDVIGQRMDFSDNDLEKVNRLYNCSSSLTFMDSCNFELENVCGMIQSSEDTADWERVSQISNAPQADQSNMGQCKDAGFFMHFNSSNVKEGGNSFLESRILYPKRNFQCLQFYYYNSGSLDDKLKIWIREYSSDHVNGTLNLVEEIIGAPEDTWQLYHVSLNVSKKFRVVFEGVRGAGTSPGGLSIDDINLSETRCPHHTWRIRNFTHLLDTSSQNGKIFSPPFYSPKGYAFQISLNISDPVQVGIFFYLISGANDDSLKWPCPWQQATLTLLDQNPDIRRRMSNQRSVTTDPEEKKGDTFYWDKPSTVGREESFPNGTKFKRGPGKGFSTFITQSRLRSRDYIKGDDVYILLTVEDIAHLAESQPQPQPTQISLSSTVPSVADLCSELHCENGGVCTTKDNKAECRCPVGEDWWYLGQRCEKRGTRQENIVTTVASTISVFVVMLIITLLTFYCTKKKYLRKIQDLTLTNVSSTQAEYNILKLLKECHLKINEILLKEYSSDIIMIT